MRLLTYLFFAFSLSLAINLQAQQGQRTTHDVNFTDDARLVHYFAELPYVDELPFFSFFVEWPVGDLVVEVRFTNDMVNYTPWESLSRDEHNIEKGITELYIGNAEHQFIEVSFDRRNPAIDVAKMHFYHPGETAASPTVETSVDPVNSFACPCPQPEIESRAEWCPAGDCPEQTSPTPTNVSHLIVHHSAGANSASDWAAIVRAIWDFHVNGNGWSDIGYNYLVDPNGVVYEGRGNNILGAHFCGTNGSTMGVCVMGDFTDVPPTADALAGLERLLAWKSCDIDADPLGESYHPSSNRTLMHISGHQDGCATSCPGDSFYPLLSDVRTGTNNQILANCAGLSSPISLSATEVDPTSYFLSWAHNSPDESGFQLERSEDGGDNFTLRTELTANTLNFIETGLELERLYHYRIRAYNEVDTSDYSNIVIVNTGVVGTTQPVLPQTALTLSPNPVEDLVNLNLQGSWTGDLQLQVQDLSQRQLIIEQSHKHTSEWNGQLDLRTLPAGIYLLTIEVEGQRGVWRVVKQ